MNQSGLTIVADLVLSSRKVFFVKMLSKIMRLNPFATSALVLAVVALIMSTRTTGFVLVLTAGVAVAALMVSMAVMFYHARFVEKEKVIVENFSLWYDIGEPAAGLQRVSKGDVGTAVRLVRLDLNSLLSNAKLLHDRVSLLLGREEFEELTQEKIEVLTDFLSRDIEAVIEKLSEEEGFPENTAESIELCASLADRVAGRLSRIQKDKPEAVYARLEPLRHAAKKLSGDLSTISTNISNFIKAKT